MNLHDHVFELISPRYSAEIIPGTEAGESQRFISLTEVKNSPDVVLAGLFMRADKPRCSEARLMWKVPR